MFSTSPANAFSWSNISSCNSAVFSPASSSAFVLSFLASVKSWFILIVSFNLFVSISPKSNFLIKASVSVSVWAFKMAWMSALASNSFLCSFSASVKSFLKSIDACYYIYVIICDDAASLIQPARASKDFTQTHNMACTPFATNIACRRSNSMHHERDAQTE